MNELSSETDDSLDMATICRGYPAVLGVITIIWLVLSLEARLIPSKCEAINATPSTIRTSRNGTNETDPVADLIEQIKQVRRELLSTNWIEPATRQSDLIGDRDEAPQGQNESWSANKKLKYCLTHPEARTLPKILECLGKNAKVESRSMGRREEPAAKQSQSSSPSTSTGKVKNQIDSERQRVTKVFLSLNGL